MATIAEQKVINAAQALFASWRDGTNVRAALWEGLGHALAVLTIDRQLQRKAQQQQRSRWQPGERIATAAALAGYESGQVDERQAVVAWLRGMGLEPLALSVQCGEHATEEKDDG